MSMAAESRLVSDSRFREHYNVNVLGVKRSNDYYSFKDYVKVRLPLQIIMGVAMTIVLPLLFPF